MGRWQPNTRERLSSAALELFTEQGFAETTVPQITARAGLTTRTFFRYFADKREVLFSGEEDLPALVGKFLADAPTALGPMATVTHGLRTVLTPLFAARLEYMQARRVVIDADEGVRERELRKLASLSAVIDHGLRQRGAEELTATLTAGLAVTAFNVAVTRWLDQDGDPDLATVLDQTLHTLGSLVAEA